MLLILQPSAWYQFALKLEYPNGIKHKRKTRKKYPGLVELITTVRKSHIADSDLILLRMMPVAFNRVSGRLAVHTVFILLLPKQVFDYGEDKYETTHSDGPYHFLSGEREST